MPTAIAESCTHFYELASASTTCRRSAATRLQAWASRFGFGVPTGIDIGGEVEAPADARVAAADFHSRPVSRHLGGRPAVEAGRLDPARDRPEATVS